MKPPPPSCCHPVYAEVVGHSNFRFPLAVVTNLMLVGSWTLRVGERSQQLQVVVQELWPPPELLLQPRLSLWWKLGDRLGTVDLEAVRFSIAYASFDLEHL